MLDPANGWALGNIETEPTVRILRTSDGGSTWRDVSPNAQSYYGLQALDLDLAWTRSSDDDELWRTGDDGESWTSLGQVPASELWFDDAQHGWRMDAEAWGLSFVQFDILSFAITQDGGQTWQERALPPGSGLVYLAFPDLQTAWAIRAGFAKNIEGFPNLAVPFSLLTTVDGAATWRSKEMPLPPGVGTVDLPPAGTYLDAGNCNFDVPVYSSAALWKLALICEKGGWQYMSSDQGAAWTITPLPARQVTEVEFTDPDSGWALRRENVNSYESDLYRTTDGGETWSLLTHTAWADARLQFVDAQAGWALATTCEAAGCNPYFDPTALLHTADGGQTWQLLQPQLAP
jgi:photosystem II stability/assembly factor-like uncharacterized protein